MQHSIRQSLKFCAIHNLKKTYRDQLWDPLDSVEIRRWANVQHHDPCKHSEMGNVTLAEHLQQHRALEMHIPLSLQISSRITAASLTES